MHVYTFSIQSAPLRSFLLSQYTLMWDQNRKLEMPSDCKKDHVCGTPNHTKYERVQRAHSLKPP